MSLEAIELLESIMMFLSITLIIVEIIGMFCIIKDHKSSMTKLGMITIINGLTMMLVQLFLYGTIILITGVIVSAISFRENN